MGASCVAGVYHAIDIQDVFFFCGCGILWAGIYQTWGVGIANVTIGTIMVVSAILFEVLSRRAG